MSACALAELHSMLRVMGASLGPMMENIASTQAPQTVPASLARQLAGCAGQSAVATIRNRFAWAQAARRRTNGGPCGEERASSKWDVQFISGSRDGAGDRATA